MILFDTFEGFPSVSRDGESELMQVGQLMAARNMTCFWARL